MTNQPLVSIIIPAYNKSYFTIKCIESVIKQTYKNIEIIVVNDGSTDDTKNALLNIKDERLKIFNIENRGACGARNYGIEKSNGKYLSFLDCDDTYQLNKIDESIKVLENNLEYYFIYTNVNFIDYNDQIVGKTPYFSNHPGSGYIAKKLILCNYNITNSTLVMRKECINNIGLFDEKIFIPADREYLIRIASKYKGYFINSFTTNYRIVDETIYSKVDVAFDEFVYMLNKFENTNVIPNKKFYNICMSNVCYNFSKIYAYNNSMSKFKEMMLKSLKYKFFDNKIIFKLGGLVLLYIFPYLLKLYFSKYNKFKYD